MLTGSRVLLRRKWTTVQSCEAVQGRLVRTPCAKCGRASAFLGERDWCPSCRAEEVEREFGLRPGLFRELATLSSKAIDEAEEPKQQRVTRPRLQRPSCRRAASAG
jgi:hypothetical protein